MAKGGKRKGAGRKPGVPNKITAQLKDLILQSLSNQGGVKYLDTVAVLHPAVFVALLGRILPLQVTDGEGKALIPPSIAFVFAQQDGAENQT